MTAKRKPVPIPTYQEADLLLARSGALCDSAAAAAEAVLADVIACMFRTGQAGQEAAAIRSAAHAMAHTMAQAVAQAEEAR